MSSEQQHLNDDDFERIDGTKKRSKKNNINVEEQTEEVSPLPMSIIGQIATYVNMQTNIFGDAGDRVEKSCPHLIICGDQSSGKSTLNNKLYEYTTGKKLNVKTSAGMATLCPFEFHYVHNMVDQPYYVIKKDELPAYFPTEEEMINRANNEIDSIGIIEKIVTNIQIQENHEEFTLVDMPGLFKNLCTFQGENLTTEMSEDLSQYFQKLLSGYVEKPNAIMLHVVHFTDDIAQSTSISLISQHIKNIVARHIIIATKIDRSTKEIVIANTNSLKQLFGQNIEIFYCVASYSSHEGEISFLQNFLGNLYPVEYLGTASLFRAIPEMVKTFVKDKINELIPALKEIKQICLDNLSKIGTEPKNPMMVAHEWSQEFHKSLTCVFQSDRREINKLIDEYTQKNNNIELLNNVGIVDEDKIKQKIQESIYSRGNSFRDTTQIDGPTKEIIIEKGKLINENFNNFYNKLFQIINQVIHKLLEELMMSFPQCKKMNEKIENILYEKISKICDEYRKNIEKYIKDSCENPSDRHSGSYLRSVAKIVVDLYNEVKNDNMPPGTLNIQNFKQWIERSPEFNNIGIKTNIIKPFIKSYMTEITNNYFDLVDIQTKTLADRLKNELYGEHVFNLVANAETLVVETAETVHIRNSFKYLLSLITKFQIY